VYRIHQDVGTVNGIVRTEQLLNKVAWAAMKCFVWVRVRVPRWVPECENPQGFFCFYGGVVVWQF